MVLKSDIPRFLADVEDSRCARCVGAECHTVVVELCAGVEFVDSRYEGCSPDLQTDFDGEEREFGKGWCGAFEGVGEEFEEAGVWCESWADLEGDRGALFRGRLVDDGGEVWLYGLGGAADYFEFYHFDGVDGFGRSAERRC